MTALLKSEWPPALLAALGDHLPAAIADVVLRRAADQAGLGPEAWNTSIQRRKLVDALCARAGVFLKGDQLIAFRRALLDPSTVRAQASEERTEFSIASDDDVFQARQGTIRQAQQWAASGIARTRAATIVSELARNIYQYAQSGTVTVSMCRGRIRILAVDRGPGIPDVEAMLSGAGGGRGKGGLGLRGSQRLAEVFQIVSAPGQGTRVTAELPLR